MELPGRESRIVKHVRHALPSAPTHAAASIATTTTSSSGGGSSSDAALPVVTYIGRSINVQQRTLAHATGQGSRRVADAISQYGPHREVRRLLLLGLDDVNGLAPEALEDVLGPTLHPDGLEFMFGFVEQTGLEWLFARRPLHIKIANVNKGAFGVSVKSYAAANAVAPRHDAAQQAAAAALVDADTHAPGGGTRRSTGLPNANRAASLITHFARCQAAGNTLHVHRTAHCPVCMGQNLAGRGGGGHPGTPSHYLRYTCRDCHGPDAPYKHAFKIYTNAE